jgi:hypothetical protein
MGWRLSTQQIQPIIRSRPYFGPPRHSAGVRGSAGVNLALAVWSHTHLFPLFFFYPDLSIVSKLPSLYGHPQTPAHPQKTLPKNLWLPRQQRRAPPPQHPHIFISLAWSSTKGCAPICGREAAPDSTLRPPTQAPPGRRRLRGRPGSTGLRRRPMSQPRLWGLRARLRRPP